MKDFVFHEEALALKELGFDEPCLKFYANKKLVLALDTDNGDINSKLNQFNPLYVSAPTFSQSFRFFREKYGLRNRNYGSLNYSGTISEYFEIFQYAKGTSDKVLSIIVGSLTYEEAELACLRKLIEIVKQKQ
jgi:hypothetical protein